ncbi:hypothetical protein HU230_0008865 [Bradyrhizobium quebecense]|uniref:Polyvalent protein metallopeptidase domain-containing protein n=1 Tax=Bradyrhizobium quebecense TaxID=2748629 RepID=A0A973WP17_9BRAD|nr:zincin-like metallopeptidase domain-containing protein [Bradyrhizobium quebecense]UGA46128.1 hypothetical protein HU230_0008865 [Bradyrhizobium quebecense]
MIAPNTQPVQASAQLYGASTITAQPDPNRPEFNERKTRLNRELRSHFHNERDTYAAEELIAELAAAFLRSEFNIDGDLRHAGFIALWIALLQRDPRAIFTPSGGAKAAVDHLRQLALAETEENGNGRAAEVTTPAEV